LTYRRIDVREVEAMNAIVQEIADKHQRLDGLVAAAGIQQETPALEYTAADCDRMLGVNVTGAFMTAQAAAKQMIRFRNGGSIVLIASMSGTIANRVCLFLPHISIYGLGSRRNANGCRDSFAQRIMPPKPLCFNWAET
jgi:NAD(P)-dependent dehydrogenase (short-subunit alcohol dehydrogenase family)